MKELIIEADRLRELLQKDLRDYVRLSKKYKARRMPIEADKPLPAIKLPAPEKISTAPQLIAHIINSHAPLKDILVVDSDAGKDNFVVYYRKGKEKEAVQLIEKAFQTCTPMWTLNIVNGRPYLQCEGPRYLPALLAYSAKKTLHPKALPHYYKAETVKSDIKPQQVICRIALTPEQKHTAKIEDLAEASAILRDTDTRVEYAADFYRNMRRHCNTLLKHTDDDAILENLQEAANHFLQTCTLCEGLQKPEAAIKIIVEYFKMMLGKYPDILENPEKYYDFDATYNICGIYTMAISLNRFANRPPAIAVNVDETLFTAVVRAVVSMTDKFTHNDPQMKAALESTAADVQALVAFYQSNNHTEEAKESLSGRIHIKIVDAYSNVLNDFLRKLKAPIFEKNDAFEATLKLNLELTQHLETFGLIQAFRENARSCQLSVLGVMMKYYRDIEAWDVLDETARQYNLALRDISADLYSDFEKVIIPLGMQIDFALARGNLAFAFERYETFCQCYFDLTKPTKTKVCRKLFDVANLGIQLLIASAEKENILDILTFSLKTLHHIQTLLDSKKFLIEEEKKAHLAIDELQKLCEKLERIQTEDLFETLEKTHEITLPFGYERLCLIPNDPTDLEYFVRAFKRLGIKYTQDAQTVTLKNPTAVSSKSLEKALLMTVRLKEKAHKYKVIIDLKKSEPDFFIHEEIERPSQTKPKRTRKTPVIKGKENAAVVKKNLLWTLVDNKDGYACFVAKDSSMAVFDFSTVKDALDPDLTAAVKQNQFSMGRAVGQFGVFKYCEDNYELKLGKLRVDFEEQKKTVKIECGVGDAKITKEVPVHYAVRIRTK